jgi:hypothetical protein
VYEDNIKMDHKEVGSGDVFRFFWTRIGTHGAAINVKFPKKGTKFFE